jgi:hypothetical protein
MQLHKHSHMGTVTHKQLQVGAKVSAAFRPEKSVGQAQLLLQSDL